MRTGSAAFDSQIDFPYSSSKVSGPNGWLSTLKTGPFTGLSVSQRVCVFFTSVCLRDNCVTEKQTYCSQFTDGAGRLRGGTELPRGIQLVPEPGQS